MISLTVPKKTKRKITHLIFSTDPNQQSKKNKDQFLPINTTSNGVPNPKIHLGNSYRNIVVANQFQGSQFPNSEEEDDFSEDDEPPEHLVYNLRCPIVLLYKEEKKRLRKPWKHILIIKLFNAKIEYTSLIKKLKKKWELKGGLN